MIEAVIFDMDGLMINSEPFWQEAELAVLRPLGVPLTLSDCQQTMGMRIDEVVKYWYRRHPWNDTTQAINTVADKIIDNVIALVNEKGQPQPGLVEAINFFKHKQFKLALASSSARRLIDAVLKKLRFTDVFEVICSAQDEPYGKPHPGVFITTAKMLSVPREYCLVLEDSPNGVLAAKSAGMKCIAIPDAQHFDDPKFCISDFKLHNLFEINNNLWHSVINK
jgi:sugar-phosphatase